ncbi:Huntingtin-interacting protein 1 [Acromyrmex echinatior]|uniref:Huntingtin-interacting protein 1 n=1 Tax=Acromyrmex echinatior TaxID=103372 RepID=F4X484_ACREC|nr:Huntingtin-interacting protein 1 [Acromyrmex echinatior]
MTTIPLTDKQLHQLSISIGKAVNSTETPVKEKHVRSAIIGTYREKSGCIFWTYMLRQPLQENQIVAWKFCHVLHKVLREGHPRVIVDSQRYRGKLEDIGKLWQHLREGYGRLIQLYARLLITKLDYHKRNPRLPGNLQVTPEELEAIGENDINIYFQMSVEMFDYMDDILNLQHAVFGSLDLSRSNSMTPCGQCRLAPLIPCIQDASQLYDCCVKILFKLHGALPADTLTGHRDRFSKQFHELKSFYNTIKHMQYFKHLITIPSLPEKPPNFLIQAELRTYVTPIVVLPPEESIDSETAIENLIDTSDTGSFTGDQLDSVNTRNGSISPDALVERDSLIDHLYQENVRQRQEVNHLLMDHQQIVADFRNRVLELESTLSTKSNEIVTEKQTCQKLMKENAITLAKVQEIEGKNEVLEEKFKKLKDVYSKLREEHINLIRKALIAKIDFITSEKTTLEEDLHDLLVQKEELDLRIVNLETDAERSYNQVKTDANTALFDLLLNAISEAESLLHHAMHAIDNPAISALTCTPDYLGSLLEPTEKSFNDLEEAFNNYMLDTTKGKVLIRTAVHSAYFLALYLIYAKSTSNTSTDIGIADRFADECKQLGSQGLIMLSYIKEKSSMTGAQIANVKSQLQKISSLINTLSSTQNNVEIVGTLVESELQSMDKAIEETVAKIQDMLDKSRAADSGLKLKVNEQILDSCTDLMKCIRKLVQKSRLLQKEIVEQGRGTVSATEFYKRNHQWSEGLISAAKAIAMGANFLLEAADKVVLGNGKFEQLVVASQGIAASTAQLVVASRVKADRNSTNLTELSKASREVTQATANVVATAKSCNHLVEENEDLDMSNLSLHQAKRLEMEAQVRILELEQALETERLRLAALRRYHYQLDGENEA